MRIGKQNTLPYQIANGSTALALRNKNYTYTGVRGTGQNAIRIDDWTGDIEISGSKFYGFRDGAIPIFLNNINATNLIISDLWFENCSGGIRIQDCVFDTITIRNLRGKDNWAAERVFTTLIQFVRCENMTNTRIEKLFQQNWTGITGDVINFFTSGGTANSPARVKNVKIKIVVQSRDEAGIITTNVGGLPVSNGGACGVMGDDGGSYIDFEDWKISNGSMFGIQAVLEMSSNYLRVKDCEILLEKRDETPYGLTTQSALGLQASAALVECVNNKVWAYRADGGSVFTENNVFPTIAGVTDDSSNLYGSATGLSEGSLLPENILQ